MSYDSREGSTFDGKPLELYLFQTEDQEWALTSSEQPRIFAGRTFLPTAITHTSPEKGAELKATEITVAIPRDHAIAQEYVQYLPSTPLSLVIYRMHRGEADVVVYFVGRVYSVQFNEDCELKCGPEEQIMQRSIPSASYQAPCNKILYSPACGVAKDAFKITAPLTFVDGDRIRAFEFSTKEDGWFTAGYVEVGKVRRMVIKHVGDELTLMVPIPGLVMGTQVSAYAGCNHKYNGHCVARFHNGGNFFGFEWVPERNPFNGLEY